MRPKIAAAASGSTNVREGGGRSGSKATAHPFCPDFPHPGALVDSRVTHCICRPTGTCSCTDGIFRYIATALSTLCL
jgi:hypothetical protein